MIAKDFELDVAIFLTASRSKESDKLALIFSSRSDGLNIFNLFIYFALIRALQDEGNLIVWILFNLIFLPSTSINSIS
jgi:hypothetical protein